MGSIQARAEPRQPNPLDNGEMGKRRNVEMKNQTKNSREFQQNDSKEEQKSVPIILHFPISPFPHFPSIIPSPTLFTSMPPHSTHLIHVHRAYVSPHDLQIRFLLPSPSLTVLTESRRKLRTEITPLSDPSMINSNRHGVIADWKTFAVDGRMCDKGSSGRMGSSG